MRLQLAWPHGSFRVPGESHAQGVRQPRAHGSGLLSFAGDDARHDHGLLPFYGGAHRRLREFSDSAADRRARHGVSVPERAVLLDLSALLHCHLLRAVGGGRRAPGRLDGLCTTERFAASGPRPGHGYDVVDHGDCVVHGLRLDGRFELHHDDPDHANEGPVDDATAARPSGRC